MLAFTIFFCESLTFSKFPIKIGTGSWAESLRSALFDEQSGRAERPLACKNLGFSKVELGDKFKRIIYLTQLINI